MTDRVEIHGLQVARELSAFIADEALPGTGVEPDRFWQHSRASSPIWRHATANFWPGATRCRQRSTPGTATTAAPSDLDAYEAFLREIGYLLPEGPDFAVTTQNVDPEISHVAGPQLVVPVMNARYALNAANARWGSLYDALYGTDAIPETDGAEAGQAPTIPCAARR